MEDEKKELSTEVKTVLHGEVLVPEDESCDTKKKSKEDRVNDFEERMNMSAFFDPRQQYGYDNNPFAQSQNACREMYNRPLSDIYNPLLNGHCMRHSSFGLWPCKNCGKF